MKINHQTLLPTIMLFLVVYFSLLASSVSMNYILPATYSQNKVVSSFQAEVKSLDDISIRKVKVGDIDIAYKQLGNST